MNQENLQNRRNALRTLLLESTIPISATTLAKQFHVSRQVIVGDIALLRASGESIFATPKGYLYNDTAQTASPFAFIGMIACKHFDDDLCTELYTIVDFGGCVIDVTIEHSVYGQISGALDIHSRLDVDDFIEKLKVSHGRPLSDLTSGIHLHRIGCKDAHTFDLIQQALKEKGIILE